MRKRFIDNRQVYGKLRDRPTIRDDVMLRHQQNVFALGKHHEMSAHQRAGFQIETLKSYRRRDPVKLILTFLFGK